MKWFISQDTIRSSFQDDLEKECGQKVSRCYQCGKCSAGCPLSFKMDYLPNQIIRMTQLGMEEEVLTSNTIWLCASCLTCTARCPREIDIAEIMDHLRRLAYRKRKVSLTESEIPLFNNIFLRNIEMFGRLYEMGLVGAYNLLSGEFFKDFALAPKMFLKRKIGLLPRGGGNAKEIGEIFRRSRRLGGTEPEGLFRPAQLLANFLRKTIGKTIK